MFWNSVFVPSVIFISCFVLGFVLETRVMPHFYRLAKRRGAAFGDVINGSLKGIIMLWAILAGIYLALLYAFYRAPWFGYVDKAIIAFAIISVTIAASRMATGAVKNYSKKVEGILPSTSIFSHLTNLLIFCIGLLVLLQTLGISITPILTALGVGGLAVALALQSTLSNLFAGLQIIMSGQLRLGDYIRLDSGEEGYITDISWRNTSIRMMSNSMILIPNSKLSSVTVINHNLPGSEISVVVEVGISYTSDLDRVEKVVLEVIAETLREVPGGVPDFQPAVRFHSFSDYSIKFNAVLRAQTYADQYLIRHEFIKRLHKRFLQEGIEIPYPVSTVHLVQ